MNKCNSCGLIFSDEEIYTYEEKHGFDYPPYEQLEVCPRCGDGFEELNDCKICGAYCDDVDERYCDSCKAKIKQRFSDFVNKNFTEEERECLNEMYEGEEI